MFHYRVKISYKGTAYRGWQAQSKIPEGDAMPTVQGTIHALLRRMCNYQDCTIAGTSRTDAGVHASGQIGKISMPDSIEAAHLLRGLNSMLPTDIRILECAACDPLFNPKTLKTTKQYHYYFCSAPIANPLLGDVVAQVPGPLDLQALARAATLFEGTHDFYNFHRRNSTIATTVRTISSCTLKEAVLSPMAENVHYLELRGEGFLKQMVRYIAAALLEVARGGLTSEQVSDYLLHHYEDKLCPKAKAHGLHLTMIDVEARE